MFSICLSLVLSRGRESTPRQDRGTPTRQDRVPPPPRTSYAMYVSCGHVGGLSWSKFIWPRSGKYSIFQMMSVILRCCSKCSNIWLRTLWLSVGGGGGSRIPTLMMYSHWLTLGPEQEKWVVWDYTECFTLHRNQDLKNQEWVPNPFFRTWNWIRRWVVIGFF